MAITVNGHSHRTLKQPLYVNGVQVKEAFVNGVKVYPEKDDLPDGAYVLKLGGSYAYAFQQGRLKEYRYGGILGWDTYKYELLHAASEGHVETTIISENPIEVYEIPIEMDTSDSRDYYRSGETLADSSRDIDFGREISRKIRVSEFPTILSRVGYRTTGTSYVSVSLRGTTTSIPDQGRYSGALAWWHLKKTTSIIYFIRSHNKTYDYGYGDSSYATALMYDGNNIVAGSTGRSRSSTVRVDTNQGNKSVSLVCGYSLSGYFPVDRGAVGGTDPEGSATWPIAYIPFTEVIYNNNPSPMSITFSNDPPTEEAGEEWRIPAHMTFGKQGS